MSSRSAGTSTSVGQNIVGRGCRTPGGSRKGRHVVTWLAWCRGVELDVAATTEDVEDYREALSGAGCMPNTIAIKLTLVRRLYDAAIGAGLRRSNPAGARAPRSRGFRLSQRGRSGALLRAISQRSDKNEDLQRRDEQWALLVAAKATIGGLFFAAT
jgi:hypothetical protein